MPEIVSNTQSPRVDPELGLHELRWWHGEESNMWTQQLDPKSLQCEPLEEKNTFTVVEKHAALQAWVDTDRALPFHTTMQVWIQKKLFKKLKQLEGFLKENFNCMKIYTKDFF